MTPADALFRAGQLFASYPRHAARLTDLRGILQNVDVVPLCEDDLQLWAEDVVNTTRAIVTLIEETREVLRVLCPPPSPVSPD